MQEKEQKISPIKQRILSFAENLGISKREFYKAIGVSRGTLESKTGITEDVLVKFIATYPMVNVEWLINGIGEMIVNNDVSEEKKQSSSKINDDSDNFYSAMVQERKRADNNFSELLKQNTELINQVSQLVQINNSLTNLISEMNNKKED